MKIKLDTQLSIFNTFKTKGAELTGEANRQRSIITILASNANPAERTRTGISQRIAKRQGIAWKNIYSGIFRDLDEIFPGDALSLCNSLRNSCSCSLGWIGITCQYCNN